MQFRKVVPLRWLFWLVPLIIGDGGALCTASLRDERMLGGPSPLSCFSTTCGLLSKRRSQTNLARCGEPTSRTKLEHTLKSQWKGWKMEVPEMF